MATVLLPLEIQHQPTDITCGPTCLHAVYRYFGDEITLEEVVASTLRLPGEDVGRGTLAVMLGIHALRRGYRAKLVTFDLQMFDPTWFDAGSGGSNAKLLADKLRSQAEIKRAAGRKFRLATEAYLEFLKLGGVISSRDLTSSLLSGFVRRGRPILTGLSATYLYRCSREWGPDDEPDDIRGVPQGHFVVIHGIDPTHRLLTVADPLADNPAFSATRYTVPISRVVGAILVGVLTSDANLLIIEPQEEGKQ